MGCFNAYKTNQWIALSLFGHAYLPKFILELVWKVLHSFYFKSGHTAIGMLFSYNKNNHTNYESNHNTKTATLAGNKPGTKRACKRSVKTLAKQPIRCRGHDGIVMDALWGGLLKMAQSSLLQDTKIAYYEAMSRFAQYRRNVLRNNRNSIQARILQSQVFA